MFEDFEIRKDTVQEEDEDSETLSYSYPSYSRFTYTGKTKSRLGRSRFMRQAGNKDETKNPDNNSSGSSELKAKSQAFQANLQAPKTPGVGWLQRDSSQAALPFTPSGKSSNVQGNNVDNSCNPPQSNFLFNLKNDSVQNPSCKRNLPFSTTPFKTKEHPPENKSITNPLKELNQLPKPENPFSKLDFFSRTKAENKENSGKPMTDMKNDLDPSWNQLKKICDSAVPYPNLPTSNSETNKMSTGDPTDLKQNSDTLQSSLFPPFIAVDRKNDKKDDDSSNMPLDLSSAETTANRTLFSRSLMGGNDCVDGDSSGSLNRQFRESIVKNNEESTQKANTDTLSGFLPRFLVPKNKNKAESPDEDVSAHSAGTVVERIFDFHTQKSFQKSHLPYQVPTKAHLMADENRSISATGSKSQSSQHISELNNELKKLLPPDPPASLNLKDPSQSSLPTANNGVKPAPQLFSGVNQKLSPPSIPGNNVFLEPSKLSPPSANNIHDFKNPMYVDQNVVKQEQNILPSNNIKIIPMKTENEINSLAQNIDAKLNIVSKSLGNDHPVVDKIVNPETCPADQFQSDPRHGDSNNQLANDQQRLLSNQMKRDEPFNSLYSEVRHEPRPPSLPGPGERSQAVVQPALPKPSDPVVYTKQQEPIQPSLNQKTFLAPQPPPSRLNGDFPHVKPEIPQLGGSKLPPNYPSSFHSMKKPNQFKMSVPRGMPSRADTELTVNGKSYGILSMLGKGGSSEVYQVLDPCTSKLLAVKCVDLSMVDKTIADGYLNEIELLSRLQGCTSVIRMFDYEYVQDCKMLYVVMEKGDTDLSHLIRDISKTKKISMSMIIYYWTEMLQAVKDIHDQGIIHSDLKPANFLLVSGRLKLIDFGIASSQGDMTSVVKEVTTGTWNYMSPEAIKNTNASCKGFKITYKSDVWSLGCILYNLVYGKTPFSHITNTWGKLTAIADPNHSIEFPDVGAPAVLLGALRSCFHREPKLRPTVAELLSLPYHSTGDSGDLSAVGRQVRAALPPQWWLKVAHLFPGVKTAEEGKTVEDTG